MKLLLCLSILVHLAVSFTTPAQDTTIAPENPVTEDLNEDGLVHPNTTTSGTITTAEQEKATPDGTTTTVEQKATPDGTTTTVEQEKATPDGTTTTAEQEKASPEIDSEAKSKEGGNSHELTDAGRQKNSVESRETRRMAQATNYAVNNSEGTTATYKDVASVKHSAIMRDTVKQDGSSREADVLSNLAISNKSSDLLITDKVDLGSAERRAILKTVPRGRSSSTSREAAALNSEGSKVADCQNTSCVSLKPRATVQGLQVAMNASQEGTLTDSEWEAVHGKSRRLGVNAIVKPTREPQTPASREMANGRILVEGYTRDDLDETIELISAERNPAALDRIVRRPGQ